MWEGEEKKLQLLIKNLAAPTSAKKTNNLDGHVYVFISLVLDIL